MAAYVFGSTARGDARATSDVDIGVVLAAGAARTPADYPMALQEDLEASLPMAIDLVVLNEAPPDLIHRVLRDGILVHEGDSHARIRFEVQARNAYFDLLPILRRYREAAIRSA